MRLLKLVGVGVLFGIGLAAASGFRMNKEMQ